VGHPSVDARAAAVGFGPLVARVPDPNGGVYRMLYWLYGTIVAMFPVGGLVVLVSGQKSPPGREPQALVVVPAVIAAIALAAYLFYRGHGSVRKRAVHLYPQGYLTTSSVGRVTRSKRWEAVKSVDGYHPGVVTTVQVLGRPARVMYRIRHHRGRSFKFTETAGHERLAPLAYELHAAAVTS
jgi:hypothetical protein